MKGSAVTLVLTSLLIAGLLWLSGCTLEGEDEADLLPQRGYGTLKLSVDDIGPVSEPNEAGQSTGRYGFWFDQDQDGEPDEFYQINQPSGGIVALSFDQETGMADGGFPVAFARFRPGKEFYEIPLESLTSWILKDRAIGYHQARYIDDKDILVYMDRLIDAELEAPLTGERKVFDFNLVSRGTVNPSQAGASSAGAPDPVDEGEDDILTFSDDDVDFTPSRLGDADSDCDDYNSLCRYEEENGFFASGWSRTDCKQRLFNITKDPRGKKYFTCVRACKNNNPGGSGFPGCQEDCVDESLQDVYGCDGMYGPEVRDIIYIVRRGNDVFRVEKGFSLIDGDTLGVFVDYADVEGDTAAGQMIVDFGGNQTTLDLPGSGIKFNSFEDKVFLGFTVAGPVPAGTFDFTITLVDRECGNQGMPAAGSFQSEGQTEEGGSLPTKMSFEMFEVYDRGLDKYTLGKGFVDISSIKMQAGGNYLYELMQFDVAIVQAYFWGFSQTDKFMDLTWDNVNKLIFTTTHDTRKTKYDETDDIQAMAFYIDQPMSAGLFTFYGDEGWNIYSKSPYGDNDDQPFMRGDFETTTIKLPYWPIYEVNTKYTGCVVPCEYWIDFIYDEARASVRGFGSREEAIQHCQAHSADPFWIDTFTCYKKADSQNNGCISLSDCLGDVPDASNNAPNLCEVIDDVYLKVEVNVDQAYLANETYADVLSQTGDEALRLGLYGATDEWKLIPGGNVTFDLNKQNYKLSMPYMPLVPDEFMQIIDAGGAMQSQLYLALVGEISGTTVVYGTGFYPPNDDMDGDWLWLVLYSYNWVDPQSEGWTLGPVSGNTIYGYYNFFEPIIEINFGDARATGGSIIEP